MYKLYVFFEREGAILSIFAYTFFILEDFNFYKQDLASMRFYIIAALVFTLNHLWFIYYVHPRQLSELLMFGVLAANTGYKILREQYVTPAYKKPIYILCSGTTCLIGIILIIFSINKLVSRYL